MIAEFKRTNNDIFLSCNFMGGFIHICVANVGDYEMFNKIDNGETYKADIEYTKNKQFKIIKWF